MAKITKDQAAQIVSLYNLGERSPNLALAFGVTPRCIRNILKRAGTELIGRSMTPLQIDCVVAAYESGETLSSSAAMFGRSSTSALVALKKKSKRSRTRGEAKRKYSVNEDFFSVIDTEQKAYWLGFIVADGCIVKNSAGTPRGVKISLKGSDRDHLRKFALDLSSTYKVVDYTVSVKGKTHKASCIEVSSLTMARDLVNKGVTPRKSLNVDPRVDLIPDNLQRHFWRGVVDGDGCLSVVKAHTGRSIVSVGLTGAPKVTSEFLAFLIKSDIKSTAAVNSRGTVTSIRFSGVNLTKRVLDLLYGNCKIALDRKAAKYGEIKTLKVFRKSANYDEN